MSEHYDFHYQPTGSGAISGQQVLEQTEDAINELGDYVNDNVGGAMDVAQEALETAQNAQNDAQTALDTANSFSSAIQSAQQDANTALSTAQTAQTTASNANNTAIQAQQDASSAVTTANNASSQASTLSGTVTALGQRVTTAEGNIGQNTSDITALTTRVGTAEGNITTLQNDVTIAQGNASSAMATAGTVKQQSYVLRYSSTALTASSTNSNTLLDNTDNLKVGDKVLDSSGNIYVVTAIDTANSTFTIGTSLIDLAQDSDVVHKSGNETITGTKTIKGVDLKFESKIGEYGVSSGNASLNFYDKNSLLLSYIKQGVYNSGLSYQTFNILGYNSNNQQVNKSISFSSSNLDLSTVFLKPDTDNVISLGRGSNRWSGIYATNYYYGSDNIEFSTKFVTTDTAQDISANKNFKGLITTQPDSPLWGGTNNTTADITSLALNCFHIEHRSAGTLTDLSGGAWCVAQIGTGCFFFRHNTGTDIRFKHFNTNTVSKICVMSNDNKFISDLCPDTTNSYNLGDSTNKWATINGLNPSSLGMPDIDNKIDISSYITDLTGVNNEYTPSVNGWISIRSSNATKISILDSATNIGNQSVSNTATYLTVMTPCIANKKVYINIVCASLSHAYFIPCQGNV